MSCSLRAPDGEDESGAEKGEDESDDVAEAE